MGKRKTKTAAKKTVRLPRFGQIRRFLNHMTSVGAELADVFAELTDALEDGRVTPAEVTKVLAALTEVKQAAKKKE